MSLSHMVCRQLVNCRQSSFPHFHSAAKHKYIKSSFKFCHTSTSKALSTRKQPSHDSNPTLRDFIDKAAEVQSTNCVDRSLPELPYVEKSSYAGQNRKVFIETYGCQMNENDTDIVWSILLSSGFTQCTNIRDADVVLVMTCAIREGAEQKIWKRLEYFKSLKKTRLLKKQSLASPLKIGILGCMAERLKNKILEVEKTVDLVCGPDAYRDLPRMLAVTESGHTAVNVLLSLDETYADIVPVHTSTNSKSAFVSIMRGCDNMCSYCIVPFTRGRERSRPISSILDEIRRLSDQGFKEVILLGQNVNSYRDCSTTEISAAVPTSQAPELSRGFKTVYRPRIGGRRFSDLLYQVARINPEMRIRFTSPHPKDFPDEVLYLIRDEPNICRQIHLPAQSGSSRVLEAMRRGYTIESYLDLVNLIRKIIPDVSLSSDFIAGFCGETEDDHQQTLDLIRTVRYNYAYCFPYSMRQKTMASHRLVDDVPDETKCRRHLELTVAFRQCAQVLHTNMIGSEQVVLIEGDSKRSPTHLAGRNEGNTKVILPKVDIPTNRRSCVTKAMEPGDYVVVKVNDASSQVLKASALYHTTLSAADQSLQMPAALDDCKCDDLTKCTL